MQTLQIADIESIIFPRSPCFQRVAAMIMNWSIFYRTLICFDQPWLRKKNCTVECVRCIFSLCLFLIISHDRIVERREKKDPILKKRKKSIESCWRAFFLSFCLLVVSHNSSPCNCTMYIVLICNQVEIPSITFKKSMPWKPFKKPRSFKHRLIWERKEKNELCLGSIIIITTTMMVVVIFSVSCYCFLSFFWTPLPPLTSFNPL